MSEELKAIQQAMDELNNAQNKFDKVRSEMSRLSNEECTAINELNNAQQNFDKIVSSIKSKAPLQSIWAKKSKDFIR